MNSCDTKQKYATDRLANNEKKTIVRVSGAHLFPHGDGGHKRLDEMGQIFYCNKFRSHCPASVCRCARVLCTATTTPAPCITVGVPSAAPSLPLLLRGHDDDDDQPTHAYRMFFIHFLFWCPVSTLLPSLVHFFFRLRFHVFGVSSSRGRSAVDS